MSRRVGSASAENTRESGSAATASSSYSTFRLKKRLAPRATVVNRSVEEAFSRAASRGPRGRRRRTPQRLGVDASCEAPSRDHLPAAHPDVAHVPAGAGPDQVGQQVARVAHRLEHQVPGVDVHQVGPPPGLQLPEVRPADRRRRRRRWPARTPRRRSARSPTGRPAGPARRPAAGRRTGPARRWTPARRCPCRPGCRGRACPAAGAMPLASLALLAGQCATATSYSRHSSRSPSSMCTQCAASTRPPRTSCAASSAGHRQAVLGQQVGALGRGLGDVQVQQQAVLAGRGRAASRSTGSGTV